MRTDARAEAKAAKARAKALRPWYRKKRFWLLGLVAIAMIAAVAGGSGGSDDETPAAGATDATAAPGETFNTTPAGQRIYAVGETATTSGLGVTVAQVIDPWTSENMFDVAAEGKRFVAVEIVAENTTGDAIIFSTLIGVEAVDDQGRAWNIALAGVGLPSIDGEVPPHEVRRGWTVFEVAADSTGLEARVKGSITATGSVFALS